MNPYNIIRTKIAVLFVYSDVVIVVVVVSLFIVCSSSLVIFYIALIP